ncbi:aromatic ring-hydroxylating oxygenase subunit alpha [Qingshengfaniella alkalisoli]|uniref:Aromatic ring-hydroxylating dioxygenase subunit alpha n=1 Tax=Qingshengfaniella alkalisoli TaxID=2599296 RepID=A0A5B8IAH2_9RHOB|nr:aromatic ring-hydroxylating dioxygenase subunit alpha [Qingshengfaniella alkalisoli]QDY71069.1 aromatic ring-hydroxylating dioxygenase subunit alpha [Qingshengfaniella alkalisoli]
MISDSTLNEWYPIAIANREITTVPFETTLMEQAYKVDVGPQGWVARAADGTPKQCIERYGHVWLCPGTPEKPIFNMPEADQPGRRLVDCGVVRVKCSPLRAVENFLDIAHFPFVHTDILGAEPHTEVERYKVDIREDDDEIWATKVKFFQPQAAKSAEGGVMTEYMYRVPSPMVSILYKTCPPKPGEWDVIAIFVQPLAEDLCDVWPWMALYDDASSMTDLIQFQQTIFLQDRSILENQIPRKLPLDPRMEVPTRADMTSIAYRRWLKKRGATYGAAMEVA